MMMGALHKKTRGKSDGLDSQKTEPTLPGSTVPFIRHLTSSSVHNVLGSCWAMTVRHMVAIMLNADIWMNG